MYTYIFYIGKIYTYFIYVYIHIWEEGKDKEGHVNLNSHHITPNEPDTNKEIINNS